MLSLVSETRGILAVFADIVHVPRTWLEQTPGMGRYRE